VEPAHFDWHWRERPALALLAWEALARDPLARLRRIQVESTGTTINFRPAAITHRDIAVSALLMHSSAKVGIGVAAGLDEFHGSPSFLRRCGCGTHPLLVFLDHLSGDLVDGNDLSLLAGDRDARLSAVWVRLDLFFRNGLIDDGIRCG